MDAIFSLIRQVSSPLLRIGMGVVVFWIGALKLVDPSPVVGLLGASLPFLASNGVVYFLGVVEVALAVMLFANFRTEYAGLALMGLFAGTLLILVIAPKVAYGDAGFPMLQLPGEFLLKDLVLFAASATISGTASMKVSVRNRNRPAQMRAA